MFCQFHCKVFLATSISFPISPSILALFIAFLFKFKYAPSTTLTYVSAIGYLHKLQGFSDPSKIFFISQMLKGFNKVGFRLDSRLPITLPMLYKIMIAGRQHVSPQFKMLRFIAMCNLAFHAFLRIGEITVARKSAPPPLSFQQVELTSDSKGRVLSLKLVFHDYKHNYNQRPFALDIPRKSDHCPVQTLLDYLAVRGSQPGPLFMNLDGSPVTRADFQDSLNLVLNFCDFSPSSYKGHSFRIGAATLAAQQGLSDAQIRLMGRWKSNAFQKYIRVESLMSS